MLKVTEDYISLYSGVCWIDHYLSSHKNPLLHSQVTVFTNCTANIYLIRLYRKSSSILIPSGLLCLSLVQWARKHIFRERNNFVIIVHGKWKKQCILRAKIYLCLLFLCRGEYTVKGEEWTWAEKSICSTILNQCHVEPSPAMFPVGTNVILIAQVMLWLARVGIIILSKGKRNARWHWGPLKHSYKPHYRVSSSPRLEKAQCFPQFLGLFELQFAELQECTQLG